MAGNVFSEDRLTERFPDIGAAKIAAILRENNGHAGLRPIGVRLPQRCGTMGQSWGGHGDLAGTGKRDVDPDDQEHVKTLLTSGRLSCCKLPFVFGGSWGDFAVGIAGFEIHLRG
ncbi:unnamed protein product [Effrenium voratum]|nr:unnamed protein product [Effrenium voratum]